MLRYHGRSAAVLLALVLLAIVPLAAQEFTPSFKPTLSINRTTGKIHVDGRLDDSGWLTASRVEKFHERNPGDNIMPDVGTTTFITYDDEKLYVAFICDDDPAAIRATMSQRDQWGADDAIAVLLNTYDDPSWAYELFVNPYGVQKDRMWNNFQQPDIGFDLIWESSGHITDSGYVVEMAIPFHSIRFPNQDMQSWRVNFWRNRPREVLRQYSWAANNRSEQCFPCQWGTVTGITGVEPGRGVEILPAMVGHQQSSVNERYPVGPLESEDVDAELSVGAKYAITSDITFEGAFNPDFSQIEADAGQIDVNSAISLFFPERRPFFQEGSDIFRTMFNSFYSRTIVDPKFAAKLTGRAGKTRLGFLAAYDENSQYIVPLDATNLFLTPGKSTSTILRASHQIGEASSLGAFVSDMRYNIGGSGTVLSLDGTLRLSNSLNFNGQYIMTHSKEPRFSSVYDDLGLRFAKSKYTVALDGESYYGDAFIVNLHRNTRHYSSNIGYNQIAPTYRTQNGFDPIANHRTVDSYHEVRLTPSGGPVVQWTPQLYLSRRWDFTTGVLRGDNANVGFNLQTRYAQTTPFVFYQWSNELWNGTRFERLWRINAGFDSQLNKMIGFGGNINTGRALARYTFEGGSRGNLWQYFLYVNLKPIDRLTIEPNISYARITNRENGEPFFNGYITRTRMQYQATKALSLRLVAQYDEFNKVWEVDPLLTYRISPFSVFYLGSAVDFTETSVYTSNPNDPSHWRSTSRQFFMKLQYMFQV